MGYGPKVSVYAYAATFKKVGTVATVLSISCLIVLPGDGVEEADVYAIGERRAADKIKEAVRLGEVDGEWELVSRHIDHSRITAVERE